MSQNLSLPEQYLQLDSQVLRQRVAARKAALADSLCILGHHYQRDEVIDFADVVGDSLKLSQYAASQKQARFIVFCGVHFMAESAEILTSSQQAVCLPNLLAGCAMADMADDAAMQSAMEEVQELSGGAKIIPITYVNSTASAKAVTARFGGACCTSSNVANVFRWALRPADGGGAGADKIFAIPDEHLGRNTAIVLGYSPRQCAVYDPKLQCGGLDRQALAEAKFILWKGQCYVHQVFRPHDIAAARSAMAAVRVIVHPECSHEVVAAADQAGSTEQIIKAVDDSPSGSQWAIGTEANLVSRLARRHSNKAVSLLGNRRAHCTQMARITLGHLLWVLDGIAQGQMVNRVSVPADTASQARIALERMISIKAQTDATKRV